MTEGRILVWRYFIDVFFLSFFLSQAAMQLKVAPVSFPRPWRRRYDSPLILHVECFLVFFFFCFVRLLLCFGSFSGEGTEFIFKRQKKSLFSFRFNPEIVNARHLEYDERARDLINITTKKLGPWKVEIVLHLRRDLFTLGEAEMYR